MSSFPPRRAIGWRQSRRPVGVSWDGPVADSAWIRERAVVELPAMDLGGELILRGEYRPDPAARGLEAGLPGLTVQVNDRPQGRLRAKSPGPWELRFPVPRRACAIEFALTGVGVTNNLAWLGRVSGVAAWQKFRAQRKNRQLRLLSLTTAAGEVLYDFTRMETTFSSEVYRRHHRPALNIVGFLTADLGVGESARCMVRAADAAGLATALVPLRLHCRNPAGDRTYADRLQEMNPHPVNVIHVDAPGTAELERYHGRPFFAGRRNIGYLAWELTEFPDAWVTHLTFYDEIWCPSEFTRRAIEAKSPVPVLAMPHAISFPRPREEAAALRARHGLPSGPFLFLVLFDLNSYAARKNPAAAVEAFRASKLDAGQAGLVVKVQNGAANPREFAELQRSLRDLPGAVLIDRTMTREEVYELESACDCLVSLHRSEGFGLALGECMYLGKPVIATNWSAPAEFLNATNGCPVDFDLVELTENCGPYSRGSRWAEPRIPHAADWMRRLAGDRALSARLGGAARLAMETTHSPAAIGAKYRARLENIL